MFPGAAEACNGRDDSCDGAIDEGLPTATWYTDADGDGFGDAASPREACAQPGGTVPDNTDCDDGDVTVSPAAEEVCNDKLDNNCDGSPGNCRLVGSYLMSEVATLSTEAELGAAGFTLDLCDVTGDGIDDILLGETAVYLDVSEGWRIRRHRARRSR